jgi:diguanylate cyclase (GGDEF)-like protein
MLGLLTGTTPTLVGAVAAAVPAVTCAVATALALDAVGRSGGVLRYGWLFAAIAAAGFGGAHLAPLLSARPAALLDPAAGTVLDPAPGAAVLLAAVVAIGLMSGGPRLAGGRDLTDGAILALGVVMLHRGSAAAPSSLSQLRLVGGRIGVVAVAVAALLWVGRRSARRVPPLLALGCIATFALTEIVLGDHGGPDAGSFGAMLPLIETGAFVVLGAATVPDGLACGPQPARPRLVTLPHLVLAAAMTTSAVHWLRGWPPDPGSYALMVAAVLASLVHRELSGRHNLAVATSLAAGRDPITGRAGRARFTEQLAAVLTQREQTGRAVAVLLCDIDAFGSVNDGLGHAVGDRLLVEMDQRLSDSIPDHASVARVGGDEFAVLVAGLLPCQAERTAHAVVEAIRRATGEPVTLTGAELAVTLSIGIVVLDDRSGDPDVDEVLGHLNAALHTAKRTPTVRSVFYSAGLTLPESQDWRLRPAAERALRTGEIVPYYQPIVDLERGRVWAVETLARWRQGDHVVVPEEFLPVVHRAGLLPELTGHMLNSATEDLAGWCRQGLSSAVRVAVNVSPSQITEEAFVGQVTRALDRSGLPPGNLILELTEEALLDDLDAAAAVLRSLQALGVQIWLDDFGAGYSSVSRLHRLPLDAVKLDKALVHTLERDPSLRRLVAGVIALGHDLDLPVVAEGIQNRSQARTLRDLGCRFGQGFLFSVPVPAHRMGPWLLRSPTAHHRDADPSAPRVPQRRVPPLSAKA